MVTRVRTNEPSWPEMGNRLDKSPKEHCINFNRAEPIAVVVIAAGNARKHPAKRLPAKSANATALFNFRVARGPGLPFEKEFFFSY